jgi:hypothetical protein
LVICPGATGKALDEAVYHGVRQAVIRLVFRRQLRPTDELLTDASRASRNAVNNGLRRAGIWLVFAGNCAKWHRIDY